MEWFFYLGSAIVGYFTCFLASVAPRNKELSAKTGTVNSLQEHVVRLEAEIVVLKQSLTRQLEKRASKAVVSSTSTVQSMKKKSTKKHGSK